MFVLWRSRRAYQVSAPTPERIASLRKALELAKESRIPVAGYVELLAAYDAEKQRADAAEALAARFSKAGKDGTAHMHKLEARAEAAEKALRALVTECEGIGLSSTTPRGASDYFYDTLAQSKRVLAASAAATGRDDG